MKYKMLATAVATAVLAACGGGGDGQPASSPTPATPSATVISGTAAVGAAIAGATVEAKCATGSGSATTAADGAFTVSVASASRPCVLAVPAPDGQTLHSVVEAGSGLTAVANITPLSELITARVAGGDPASFFATFDAAAQGKVTASGVTGAVEAVRDALGGVIDLAGIDPLKDTLVAANGSQAGNGLDQKLDQLGTIMEQARVTLTELATAVASSDGSAAPAVQTMTKPASASCATLRSGNYLLLDMLTANVEKVTVDAAAPSLTLDADKSVVPLSAHASESCRFTAVDSELLVSTSGISLVSQIGSTPSLMIPSQSIPVAELAGTWSALGYESGQFSRENSRVTFTVGADGKLTSGFDCNGFSACEAWPAGELGTITANAQGGFDFADPSGVTRAIAFKGTDGQLSMVLVHAEGFLIGSKQMARPLPVVGTRNVYWDTVLDPFGSTQSVGADGNEVTAVDSAAGTFTRVRASDGRIDTWRQNYPVDGMRYRLPATGVRESLALPMPGTGIIAITGIPGKGSPSYAISVERPKQ